MDTSSVGLRNGRATARKVTCGAGTLEVSAPRVNDKRVDEAGRRKRFTSRILPPYMRRRRRSRRCCRSSICAGYGRFPRSAAGADDAAGLSATNIARLTAVWAYRSASETWPNYVYVWVDGTTSTSGSRTIGCARSSGPMAPRSSWRWTATARAPTAGRPCCGTCSAGACGPRWGRSATAPWASGRPCAMCGRRRASDWCHKMGNVLDKLPKRLQPKAKRALREIMYADTRAHAEEAMDIFIAEYEAKYPKAATCLDTDRERLLTHFAFPAEHWQHVRTSNVIESPCYGPAPAARDQRRGLTHQGSADGLQAA